MNRFSYDDEDPWTWLRAGHEHVPGIVDLVDTNYSGEIESVIFTKNPARLHYHLHQAVLDQQYNLNTQLVMVAVQQDRIQAWSWITRGSYTVYADQEMATAEFAHVDLTLPPRPRIRLLSQIIEQWQAWCWINQIPVLCSTSIRSEHGAFMRLHEQQGFQVRGTCAYKKIL